MKNLDFNLMKSLLLDHFRKNLEKFAATIENKEVYAVILDCHATYGTVNMKWNTVNSFKNRADKYYSSYTPDQLLGARGVEYNVGDFYYEDSKQPEEINNFENLYENVLSEYFDSEDEESYNELIQKFINTLVEIVYELAPTFSQLNKTDNFIAYIVEHDSDDLEYIKKTVTIEDYYKAFPKMKEYDQYLSTIYSLPKEDQVTHWCNLLYELLIEKDTDGTRSLKQMYRNKYDVEEEIIKLGLIASSNVVTLFEVFSGYVPSVDGLIIQSEIHTRWMFLNILIDIKNADEETINRLKQILIRKYEIDNEIQECINIARTLHALDSSRFPEEVHDKSRVRLLNFEEYKNK
ncbi:protein of unknown function [Fontibacillus panacisegetis]|uniref:DUF4303 domain-containing protein n=1 Tax=Fontibacillus panacisegetis TaxID=670482 RepID=A0A1G7TZD1_9BACL|nr:DUF4303 domain-containing protein [Fontibacillus panacisegetis]SDG40149.1 protein of unknown function [Fontibacillus panacisegetis]